MDESFSQSPNEVSTKSALLAAISLRPDNGADLDAATGWPKRVVHEKSGAVLTLIPAGEFMMGAPAGENGDPDEVHHRRLIRSAFYLGVTTVTQVQWQRIMTRNPSKFRGADLPVDSVSWTDCQRFLEEAGGGVRLPSEAEWEYACRAGTETPFSFGAGISVAQVNFRGNPATGDSTEAAGRESTVACGSLPANAWGIHEMHGNVWEWCQDVMADYAGHGDERAWDAGSGSRVLRGGSWYSLDFECRSAARFSDHPDESNSDVGFRLAISLPMQGEKALVKSDEEAELNYFVEALIEAVKKTDSS